MAVPPKRTTRKQEEPDTQSTCNPRPSGFSQLSPRSGLSAGRTGRRSAPRNPRQWSTNRSLSSTKLPYEHPNLHTRTFPGPRQNDIRIRLPARNGFSKNLDAQRRL